MNQSIMTGNLTADIETRDVGEQHLSKFTLACNEGERVVFMPIEAWNMPHLAEFLFKGSKALISGTLKQDNWETESGDKRSRIVLTAYKVEFLDPASDASEARTSAKSSRPPAKNGNSRKNYPSRRQRSAA